MVEKTPFEEARKIQITGRSTYIVSLPKKWVKEMNLGPGDRLLLKRQSDSSLLVTPKLKKLTEKKEVIVNVSPGENPYAVARKIISLYLVGYNAIRLSAGKERITAEQRAVIKDVIRKKLIGTEIITDSPNEMSLKILISYPELSVKSALERMYSIARSMYNDALTALAELNYDLARNVIDLDDDVDRFNLYIVRQLKSAVQDFYELKEMGLTTPRDCLGYRIATKSIERVADHAVKIAGRVLSFKRRLEPGIVEKVLKLNELADSIFEMAVNALFAQDYELAERVLEKSQEMEPLENEAVAYILKRGLDMEDLANLRLILVSIKRVSEYAGDIAEVVLNLTVDKAVSRAP